MTLFETGRLCVKTAGREAGSLCVVLDKAEKDYVLVTGPKVLSGVRKRKCNIEHLEPLPNKIKIKADASDSEILDHLKNEEDVLKKFDLKVPTADEIKKMEAHRAERIAKKAELEKARKAAPVSKKEEKKIEPKTEKKTEAVHREEEKPALKDVVSEKPKEEKPKEAKVKKEAKPKEAKAEKKKE